MPIKWEGKIEEYPLSNYPDYEPGKAPQVYKLHNISYLDEYAIEYNKPWGNQGIGRLREVMVTRPTDWSWEINPLFCNNTNYFVLKFGPPTQKDIEIAAQQYEMYKKELQNHGVKVHEFLFPTPCLGTYGPLRKLIKAAEVLVIRGGAIMPRYSHGAFKRGLNFYFQKFMAELGCPILLTVAGNGVFESSVKFVAEDVCVTMLSAATNQEGLDQVLPVMKRAGMEEVHIAHLPGTLNILNPGGIGYAPHINMSLRPVDLGVVLVYPPLFDFYTLKWLLDKKFTLIEVPTDEQTKYWPTSSITELEAGKILMAEGPEKTIRAIRKEGIDVIELPQDSLMKVGGMGGGYDCNTCKMIRDPGPRLEELYK